MIEIPPTEKDYLKQILLNQFSIMLALANSSVIAHREILLRQTAETKDILVL